MAREPAIPRGLERIEVPSEAGNLPVPFFVDSFIRDAEDRAEEYGDRAGKGSFVPSDARYAFQVLLWLLRSGAARKGGSFLEWGSGQGMAAILASLVGFDATGVEIDATLVKEAAMLARRYGARAAFVHGSYDPGTPCMRVVGAEGRDLVYVYPWPGEEGYFLRLFDSTAKAGGLLLMGLGPEDVRVYRKKGG
jgi:predicted O-methyltransferase YrrM